jgi:hypothetical protein
MNTTETNTADTFGTVSSNTNTQISTGTFTVSPTVTRFSTNISIPAAATTGIQILFTVGALTSGLTWTIGNVQLERGSTASSFDYRPYGTELALCQRYYYRTTASGTSFSIFGTGWNETTATGNHSIRFPVTMRIRPTALEQSGTAGHYAVLYAGTSAVATSVPAFVNYTNSDMAAVLTGTAAVLTAGQGSALSSQNNISSAYLGWSAEL